ncbi:MAG: site-specific integrase [Nocardioidaceae bacterium]|nr:site-specific integrase [Nocardioidaceae bacterium]
MDGAWTEMYRSGMASIRKRASGDGGKWQVRYVDKDGRSRAKSFKRKSDAQRYKSEMEADLARGNWLDPDYARESFGGVAMAWADYKLPRLKPTTRSGYEALLRAHILPEFGSMPIGSIRPRHVEHFITKKITGGLSRSRTAQAYRLLAQILGAAVENEYILKSPAAGIKPPRSARQEMHVLKAAEVSRLVFETPAEYQALILTLAYCGLRWGEAVALRRGRVDLLRKRLDVRESASEADGRLYFGPTKTYQARSAPLPGFLVEALSRHMTPNGEPEELVFTSSNGQPLRGSNFRPRVWFPALERAELPRIRIHDLRHTCAALLIDLKHSPKSIQTHLGHSSITVTLDTYGHLYKEEQDRIAASLDKVWAGAQ